MEQDLSNLKFSAIDYSKRFLATEKQKDFIIDNIEWYRTEKEQEDLIKNLDKLTKKLASEVIGEIIESLEDDDFYDFEDFYWKD